LTPAQKYEVGKQAAEHGVTASVWYFNKKYPAHAKGNNCPKIKEQLP